MCKNKPMTVHELIKFLQTVPNQNMPIQIVATADLMSVVTGDVAYVEAGKRAVELHCHGSLDFLDDDDLLDDD